MRTYRNMRRLVFLQHDNRRNLRPSGTTGSHSTTDVIPPQTSVSVGTINVDEKATMPGILNGVLNTTTLNFMINSEINGDVTPDDLGDLVTDAVKINSRTIKSFIPKDITNSTSKLTGTKDEVEGLSRRWCYLIASLVVLSFITLLGTAVLSLTSWRTAQGPATDISPATQTTIDGLSAEEKHLAEVAGSPIIVGRIEWLAQPSKWTVKNTLPVRRVVVGDTTTDPCQTSEKCVETVRTTQMVDVEQRHQPDIRDNFLIGGDGKVYWGRGFDSQGNYTEKYNNGSIGVSFIGDFDEEVPSEPMLSAFQKLVDVGVRAGKISGDFGLMAQCQLTPETSTGSSLLRAIKSWPQYDPTAPYKCITR